ncbi:fimbria/pilus outer membrane usher protein [Providencia hangzhouensis]
MGLTPRTTQHYPAGYSYSDMSRSMNGTLSGGIVAHSDGITLSPNVGDTIAIITAEGAKRGVIILWRAI